MRHALCKPAAYFVRILLRRLRLILSLRYNSHTTVLFIDLLCAVEILVFPRSPQQRVRVSILAPSGAYLITSTFS